MKRVSDHIQSNKHKLIIFFLSLLLVLLIEINTTALIPPHFKLSRPLNLANSRMRIMCSSCSMGYRSLQGTRTQVI